ncbi:MAG: type II toxin-antitoxin system PemK/MazF family toxin [Planctomycetes bacterium]|nr:type II toxin-antitoxin system PemK/MazF family toxin [Planctomycetota bacterium]
MTRGDIVIVDFRPHDPKAKVRPALVIQNDRDNARLTNTIVAAITSVTRRSAEPTQLLIDRAHPDWKASGLRYESAINCCNVFTLRKADVKRGIGRLSTATMQEIDECLKEALGIA